MNLKDLMNKENISSFLKRYSLLFIIYLIYVVFCVLTWGHYGSIVSDSFREAVLPEAVLKGKVFYKDFFILYPPLAYYFNALLYKIFGASLSVLYLSAMVAGAVLLGLIYKITEIISSNKVAFVAATSVMLINIFRIWDFNTASWFFPYSFSFLYAFVSVFTGVLAYILYLKTEKITYLYLSVFFTGLSLAFKADFIVFALLLLIEAIKQKCSKTFLKVLLAFFVPVFFTLLIYFFTGGNFEGLKNWAAFLTNFSRAESVRAYNISFMPQKINSTVLSQAGTSFLCFLKFFATFFVAFFLTEFTAVKTKKKWPYVVLFVVLFLFLPTVTVFVRECISYYTWLHFNFVFLPYALFVLGLCGALWAFLKREISDEIRTFLILLAIAFCLSFRDFAAVYISNIGNFTIVAYIVAFVYFLLEIFPKFVKSDFRPIVAKALACSLLLYSVSYTYIYLNVAASQKYKVQTRKGTFYLAKSGIDAVKLGLDFAQTNIKGAKTLLSFDEGSWVNFLNPDIELNYKLHLLNRHTIEALGEEIVLEEISKNPPDYIYYFILPVHQRTQGRLGEEYCFKIGKYIKENYNIKAFSNGADLPEGKANDIAHYYRLIIYERK